MKKLITLTAVMVSITLHAQNKEINLGFMPPFGLDKITHFLAGGGISYMTYHAIDDKKKAFTIAFFAGLGAGFLKEGFDYAQGKPFNLKDIGATTFGALMGTVSFKAIMNFKHKAKGDNSDFENIGPVKENMFSSPIDTLTNK